jgi:hypothetical protein
MIMHRNNVWVRLSQKSLIYFLLTFSILFSILVINISILDVSAEPTLQWQQGLDVGENDEASAIALDDEGYIYVIGNTGPLKEANDVFLLKYDPSGNLLQGWPIIWDSGEHEWALDLIIGPDDYLYIVGFTYIPVSPNDVFILKYDKSGNLQSGWPKFWHADVMVDIYDMEIDKKGNIYIAGNTRTGEDPYNTFILKFDSEGNMVEGWPIIWDSGSTDVARIVQISPDGYLSLSGDTRSEENPWNVFLLKYDSSGKVLPGWPIIWDSGSPDWSFGMTLDPDGNIYLTGFTAYGENPSNVFLLKYDSSGNLQPRYPIYWDSGVREIIPEHERFGEDRAFEVKASLEGEVYLIGSTTLGDNPFDILILKYDSSGNLQPGYPIYFNSGGSDDAFSIEIDEAQNIYVAGHMGPYEGAKDVLILKYHDEPSVGFLSSLLDFSDFRIQLIIIAIIIIIGILLWVMYSKRYRRRVRKKSRK